jgi:hypothetical protein
LASVGPVQDTYAPTNLVYLLPINLTTPTNQILLWTNQLTEFDCGMWLAPSNGNYQFKFTVVNKNSASSGYQLAFDDIKLTPVPPSLTVTGQSGKVVISWPTNAGGYLLESTTNLTSTNWSPVPSAPSVVGSFNVITNPVNGSALFYRLRDP